MVTGALGDATGGGGTYPAEVVSTIRLSRSAFRLGLVLTTVPMA